MSASQSQATAVQEGLDMLFVAAVVFLLLSLVVPSVRTNTMFLVGGPLLLAVIAGLLAAISHVR